MKTHKDLIVWKKSLSFVTDLYSVTSELPGTEKFGLISQIRRAGISNPSNIAEGTARNSDKEFIHFLYISLGSVSEIETQLLIAQNLGIFKFTDSPLENDLNEILRMLASLIRKIKQHC